MSDDQRADPWIMIPARGGSRGVPRKNLRMLGDLPLICHAIRCVQQSVDSSRIFVITDDDEIAAVAAGEGIGVLREPRTTGKATLDDVALKVAEHLEDFGAKGTDIFLTIQPTCPFVSADRIREAVAAFDDGAGCVVTVVDDRHLGWRLDEDGQPTPDYAERVNRQVLPPQFRESGAIIGCRLEDLHAHGTRIVAPINLIEIDRHEGLDIDDFSDWAVARHLISQRKIVIRTDASATLGMGHVYRALAVAQELARHNVTFVTDQSMPLGTDLLSRFPFTLVEVDGARGFEQFLAEHRPDLVVLDQLDTSVAYLQSVKARATAVVTFEDLGPGATLADLVISDLYENLDVPQSRQLSGVSNAILAPQFETLKPRPRLAKEVETVLVVFGGSDPAHLTERTLKAISQAKRQPRVLVVAGPGVQRSLDLDDYGLDGEVLRDVSYMPGVMRQADLAISSAGRTVTELLSCGVPVLCMCQNEKELAHTHASARYGVVNIGLGSQIETATLVAHFELLIDSSDLREKLTARAAHELAGRSNRAIINRMLEMIGWDSLI